MQLKILLRCKCIQRTRMGLILRKPGNAQWRFSGKECPVGELGSAVSPVSPHSSLLGVSVRSRKGLDDVRTLLSNNKNIYELSTLFSAQIQNITPCWLL